MTIVHSVVRAYTNVRSRDGCARKGDKQRRQRQNKSTLQHKSLAAAAAADHRQGRPTHQYSMRSFTVTSCAASVRVCAASEVGGALGGGGEKWQAVEGWIPLLGICINKTAIERKFAMGAFEVRAHRHVRRVHTVRECLWSVCMCVVLCAGSC